MCIHSRTHSIKNIKMKEEMTPQLSFIVRYTCIRIQVSLRPKTTKFSTRCWRCAYSITHPDSSWHNCKHHRRHHHQWRQQLQQIHIIIIIFHGYFHCGNKSKSKTNKETVLLSSSSWSDLLLILLFQHHCHCHWTDRAVDRATRKIIAMDGNWSENMMGTEETSEGWV